MSANGVKRYPQERPSRWYTLAYGALFTVLAACGGSGGGSGCGAGCGLAPIRDGYPAAERVANAAQVRLTSHAMDFLERNVHGILNSFVPTGLDFPLPRYRGTQDITIADLNYDLCPSNNCTAHVDVQSLTLTPWGGDTLRGLLMVNLDSRNTAGIRATVPLNLDAGWLGTTACSVDINTLNGARRNVAFQIDFRFLNEGNDGRVRQGLTKLWVDPGTSGFAPGQGIEDADINVSACSGFLGDIVESLLPLFKGQLVGTVEAQIPSILQGAVDGQLCQKRGATGCPVSSYAVPNEDANSVCRYGRTAEDECVPMLLGTEGQADLGALLLSSFSPGAKAPVQFSLASGGSGEATNEGMSLFMEGGLRSADLAGIPTNRYHNSCVPLLAPPSRPTVARVASFRGNTIPGTAIPIDVGVGISEDFLNHAGFGMFDSGMFCLAAGTKLSQQLSTGLLGVLSGNLPKLTYPLSNAPVALSLRPQAPPVFEVGAGTASDPLITVTLPRLDIDIYAWVSERYVRILTYRSDLKIALNLTVDDNKLQPVLLSVESLNSSVSNTELLGGNTSGIPAAMQSILGLVSGMLTSAIPSIALPDLLGFQLTIPANGIKGISESGEEFIGIFANLGLTGGSSLVTEPVETNARLVNLEIDPQTLKLDTFKQGRKPLVRVFAETPNADGRRIEYSYRVDGTMWSPWSSSPTIDVQSEAFYFQARHEIEVRSRVAGSPRSMDLTPSKIIAVVDAEAPVVDIVRSGDKVRVSASDRVSPNSKLQLRYRIGTSNGPQIWTNWSAIPRVLEVAPLAALEVEVKDEAGHVGRAKAGLIRGTTNPQASSSGCGCRVSNTPTTRLHWFGLLGVMGVVAARMRRKTRAQPLADKHGFAKRLLSLLALVASACGGSSGAREADAGVTQDSGPLAAECTPTCGGSELCCTAETMCVAYDRETLCDPGFECADEAIVIDDSCQISCSSCVPRGALAQGSVGTYLDAVWSEGKMILSGYNAGVVGGRKYGDLVVGQWQPGDSDVQWETIDGVPNVAATNDPDGWRGGVTEQGDDVGRWSSIAAAADGKLFVAYHDTTNGALKVATSARGVYETFALDSTAVLAGRYASIAIDQHERPVIAYQRIVNNAFYPQYFDSEVVVKTATTPAPASALDFTETIIVTRTASCRPEWCADGDVCLATGECATPETTCGACAAGSECVAGACQVALTDSHIQDMPNATGLYTQLARTPTGLGIVYYDRTDGSLYASRYVDGEWFWEYPFVLDGYGRSGCDYDAGIGASLFIDNVGTWHVAYSDSSGEALRYLTFNGSSITRSIVDDGSTDGSRPFTDGRHVVGDDSSIVVLPDGRVRIVYQDATSQTLRLALRSRTNFELSVLSGDATHRGGFWNRQVLDGGTPHSATFWMSPGYATSGVTVISR